MDTIDKLSCLLIANTKVFLSLELHMQMFSNNCLTISLSCAQYIFDSFTKTWNGTIQTYSLQHSIAENIGDSPQSFQLFIWSVNVF